MSNTMYMNRNSLSLHITHTLSAYAKHYYAGSERVSSAIGLGGLEKINDPLETAIYEEWTHKYDILKEGMGRTISECLGNEYQTDEILKILYDMKDVTSGTMERYFYHPDHLGSSSWVTDNAGKAIQHLHYLPFGEDWVEQRTTSWCAPYTFSAKEKDVETGYSYFGARYYDSGLSIWLSVDPMSDNTPFATPYAYCANNPLKFVDPTGMVYGDYYSRTGEWLGNDGIDDNKIYLQDDNGTTFYTPTGTSFTEVGGLIIQNRIEEGADYTISEFKTVGGEISVSGYMLEPAGPSTTVANQDKRIPEGVYDVDSYSSAKFPDNFILSNEDVSKDRKILYHTGNTGSETSGCNLPGSSKGEGRVNGSKDKMSQLRSFIHSVGNLVNSNSNGNKIVKTIINNSIED